MPKMSNKTRKFKRYAITSNHRDVKGPSLNGPYRRLNSVDGSFSMVKDVREATLFAHLEDAQKERERGGGGDVVVVETIVSWA